MPGRTRVAVIGAGLCGVAAMKALKEEGLDPVCFEKTGHYGGLWRYRDTDADGEGSVMKTTIFNTSKEISAASNLPPPKEFPNYLPHNLLFEYITMMVNEFDIVRHIRYYHEVTSVKPSTDYKETGRWIVTTRNTRSGTINDEIFECVMVCIGHHAYPNIPTFPGLQAFQGKVLHSHSLKSNSGFEGQRVLVVGCGSSALDAATDISTVAKQVYLSCRRGSWVLPRMGPNGHPFDSIFLRRSMHLLQVIVPHSLVCSFTELMLNLRFKHSTYNIKPQHRVWSQHPAVSDMLPISMITGAVVARRDIRTFVSNGVIFDGEKDVTEVDSVILATGYTIKFPFLSDDIVRVDNNKVKLYKYMYPPDLQHPSLLFIGLIQPFGPVFPVAELQSRLASMVLSGKCSLPSRKAMWKDINKKERANQKRYFDSPRHTVEVNYIGFSDELATLIGARPNLLKMALTDPKLFWACTMGPFLSYQYRLQGPHSWDGARNAILNYKEREFAPFGGSRKKKSEGLLEKSSVCKYTRHYKETDS